MTLIKTVGAGLLASLALATPPALAQDSSAAAEFHATTITLSAQGQVTATPDLAVIRLGVQSDGATAAIALARNRDRMNATFAALKGQGVADRDIQTSELSIDGQYVNDGKSPARLTSYHVGDTVTVRLHDLPKVGGVVDALVAAGANQVDGVSFALADPAAQQDQARLLAVKALQAKADLYARAMGYKVSRLVHLSEGGGGGPMPMAMMRTASFKATPIAPGELTVSVEVSAEFELAR
jgi:uncharacterized protein YggE